MHRSATPDYQAIRSAAWLLMDLIDEACERPESRGDRVALTTQRWAVMDVLSAVRKLEPVKEPAVTPGQLYLTQDFPA